MAFLKTVPHSAWYLLSRKEICSRLLRQRMISRFSCLRANETDQQNLLTLSYKIKNNRVEISHEDLNLIFNWPFSLASELFWSWIFYEKIRCLIATLAVSKRGLSWVRGITDNAVFCARLLILDKRKIKCGL